MLEKYKSTFAVLIAKAKAITAAAFQRSDTSYGYSTGGGNQNLSRRSDWRIKPLGTHLSRSSLGVKGLLTRKQRRAIRNGKALA